jgi:mRNA interferase RelE/StbE
MYKLEFTNNSLNFLKSCEAELKKRILGKLENLSSDAFPPGCIKIKNSKDIFRIRIGDYRVLYSVLKDIILIQKIDKRERVYD